MAVEGLEELEKVLKNMPRALAERDMTGAARAGANITRKSWRDKIPKSRGRHHPKYGSAKKNLRVTAVKNTPWYRKEVVLHNGRAFWLLFLEFGAAPHKIKPRKRRRGKAHKALGPNGVFGSEVDHPGVATPDPILTKAVQETKDAAFKKIGEQMFKNLEKTATELAGKYGSIRKSTRNRL